MPPKRTPATASTAKRSFSPAAASPEVVANSAKPSTAVSSKPPHSTSSSLKGTTSSSSAPTIKSTSSTTPSSRTTSTNNSKSSINNLNNGNAQQILQGVWDRYTRDTPSRVKLVDVFMAFLVVVGGLQFVYCVLAGNYPFNAFLSGFSATVGQFVLTASLRIQTNPENKVDFKGTSDERAFADYVFGSLLLHFFCVNFIN